MSVLEVSATKRDAKGYLQKYTSKNPKSLAEAPKFVQGEQKPEEVLSDGPRPANVAIMKLRAPQEIDSDTLQGVAKTLSQLRKLGLFSVVVVDCGIDEHRLTFQDQVFRLCEAIDAFGDRGAKMVRDIFSTQSTKASDSPSFLSDEIKVEDNGLIGRTLQHGMIPIIPSIVSHDDISPLQPVDSNKIVLALTKYFTGLQFPKSSDGLLDEGTKPMRPEMIASVERIIILDPLGGTPFSGRPGFCHRFINLEQEYSTLIEEITTSSIKQDATSQTVHAANLNLARDALAMLPSSSSALITTPFGAANLMNTNEDRKPFGFGNMVTTRRKKNPLIHNLLTDKPVFSSSLPILRTQSNSSTTPPVALSSSSTLVKRGMPLTIFPDPKHHPWSPPKPGSPRLRLTDNCIDLPRLVHLIEDSFNRKLDVEDYLNRVNENIAGIIVAGEYEGGAILTWERPDGLDEQAAHEQGRFVPYLDKFAVLKRSQGSGGVADIVFNAMVGECFPEGVSWRSRKDNPVNKWYFERSAGTNKLSGCNWTMFWTTPDLDCRHPALQDYESVCRGVEPSWADNKHILD